MKQTNEVKRNVSYYDAPDACQFPSTARGRARYDKIVETAARLFVERGTLDVPLSDIVKETGGSLATVYKWFGSKEYLVFAVVSRQMETLRDRLNVLEFRGDTVKAVIENMLDDILDSAPYRLLQIVLLNCAVFSIYQGRIFKVIEYNTVEPVIKLLENLREQRNVELALSDREYALVFVRYFRGLILEYAFSGEPERVNTGKESIKVVLTSLVVPKDRGVGL